MYIKIINSEIVEFTIQQLKDDNKNISFPLVLTDEILQSFGVFRVHLTDLPNIDYTKNINSEIIFDQNKYIQVHNIVDAPDAEISLRISNKWNEIREIRNRLLLETDWTQISDSPLSYPQKEQYKSYRQQLRDISANFNNPFDVIFPTLSL